MIIDELRLRFLVLRIGGFDDAIQKHTKIINKKMLSSFILREIKNAKQNFSIDHEWLKDKVFQLEKC
jgi:hypothetical protein